MGGGSPGSGFLIGGYVSVFRGEMVLIVKRMCGTHRGEVPRRTFPMVYRHSELSSIWYRRDAVDHIISMGWGARH